jgi:hypothetical protein
VRLPAQCSISKAGNRYLRQLLVVGAMAVIRYAERNGTRRPWLVQLMARRTTKVAAVALANKTARMVVARGLSRRASAASRSSQASLDRAESKLATSVVQIVHRHNVENPALLGKADAG